MAPGKKSATIKENEVPVEVSKLGKSHRKIQCKIAVKASLDTIWDVLTDYDRFSDFIPTIADSKVIDRKDNVVRFYQIGQQNLPLGLKFSAKMILDSYEKETEIFASGRRRDVEFKMVEGDLQSLEGKWTIEQIEKGGSENGDSSGQEFESTLSYCSEVKFKPWLPVQLIEGKLQNNIKTNLVGVQQEAERVTRNALSAQ